MGLHQRAVDIFNEHINPDLTQQGVMAENMTVINIAASQITSMNPPTVVLTDAQFAAVIDPENVVFKFVLPSGSEYDIYNKVTYIPEDTENEIPARTLFHVRTYSVLNNGTKLIEGIRDKAFVLTHNNKTAVQSIIGFASAQADSTATTVAGLKDDFNALLAKLKAAGLMHS